MYSYLQAFIITNQLQTLINTIFGISAQNYIASYICYEICIPTKNRSLGEYGRIFLKTDLSGTTGLFFFFIFLFSFATSKGKHSIFSTIKQNRKKQHAYYCSSLSDNCNEVKYWLLSPIRKNQIGLQENSQMPNMSHLEAITLRQDLFTLLIENLMK